MTTQCWRSVVQALVVRLDIGLVIYEAMTTRVPVVIHVFYVNKTVQVPWFSCLGGYLFVPDDYPLVLGCEDHGSSSCVFVA